MPHKFTLCVRFLAFSLALHSVVALTESGAAERIPAKKREGFVSGTVPSLDVWLQGAYTAQDGTKWARGARADWRVGPGRDIETVVAYPYLYLNDIVPMRGYLYRVTVIDDQGEPKGVRGHDSVSMEWVEYKKLPPGITFQPGSFAVPVEHDGDGSGAFNKSAIYVPKIEPSKEGPVADVRVIDQKDTTVRVRRGDVLTIGKARYKVRNVVPRDPKTHVIGWVELDPEPLKEEKKTEKDAGK